jgi:hypothetical protein
MSPPQPSMNFRGISLALRARSAAARSITSCDHAHDQVRGWGQHGRRIRELLMHLVGLDDDLDRGQGGFVAPERLDHAPRTVGQKSQAQQVHAVQGCGART